MHKVGIFGIGVVGKNVVEQLSALSIQISGLYSKTKKETNQEWYENWRKLVDDSDVIVETIGGIEIAKEIIDYALQKGKKVVTANKYLLSVDGMKYLPKYQELIKFEASVCGVMPVINLISNYLKSDKIIEINGILNGTNNYIATKMQIDKISFDEALKSAQELGYAETDPSFDIEGIDAAQKAIILHYLAFDEWINIKDVSIELPKDAKLGEKSIVNIKKGQISIQNSIIKEFENVIKNQNALQVKSEIAGEITLIGFGAGGKETAYAVSRDIMSFLEE